MLALSVRQPWAHAIIHLGKPIENRPRGHSYRGLLLIHASAGMTGEEYEFAVDFMREGGVYGAGVPDPRCIERGGIIGAVDMVDCVKESDDPWWMGPAGFVLQNPRPLPFIPCKGTVAPLLWTPPADVAERCRRALSIPA